MDKTELAKLEAYLRRTFSNHQISVRARMKKTDSAEVYLADDKVFCDTLDKCRDVSLFLLDCAGRWLGDD